MFFDFHFFSCMVAGVLGLLIALGERKTATPSDDHEDEGGWPNWATDSATSSLASTSIPTR